MLNTYRITQLSFYESSWQVMSSRSRFDNFIASRNINPARGRGFRAYLHSNTGRQEFGLDPISAASDSPGRETNSSALVNRPFVASSGSNTSCITNYFTLTTSSCDDDLGTFTRTASILSSPIMSVVIPSAGL